MDRPQTIQEIRAAVGAGAGGARRAVDDSLGAIDRVADLNALCAVQARAARSRADLVDAVIGIGRSPGPLAGVPLAVKDNVDQAGEPAPAACRAYLDRIPSAPATLVERLQRAGAILVGRTNMHELADGVTSEVSCHGPVLNPWQLDRIPGGSSGGSAVAVAAGCVPAAIGTDTGGSIRIPAALCGVVGLKPTTGLVPTAGIVPLSTSLDCAGPIARTVIGAATLLEVLAGTRAAGYRAACRAPVEGLRIGVLTDFGAPIELGVAILFERACGLLAELGCALEPVAVDGLADGIRLLAQIYAPEAAAWHAAALAERPGDFGPAIRADLARGAQADPAKRRAALQRSAALAKAMEAAMTGLDLLISPTTPVPALPFGAPAPHVLMRHTCPLNLTGQPALSVPMGTTDGLPAGLQLVGRPQGEAVLFTAAAAFERALAFDCTPAVHAWGDPA